MRTQVKTSYEKKFKAFTLAWFASGLAMACSAACVPLCIAFAVVHFALFPIVLFYAIKLSSDICNEICSVQRDAVSKETKH